MLFVFLMTLLDPPQNLPPIFSGANRRFRGLFLSTLLLRACFGHCSAATVLFILGFCCSLGCLAHKPFREANPSTNRPQTFCDPGKKNEPEMDHDNTLRPTRVLKPSVLEEQGTLTKVPMPEQSGSGLL